MSKTIIRSGNEEHELIFEPKKHSYFLNGEPVPSVTTILDQKAKPALLNWAVNETVAGMRRLLKPGQALNEVQIEAMLKYAKNARYKTSDKAKNIGSLVHDWIEEYIKYCIANDNLRPIVIDPTNENDIPNNVLTLPFTEEARSSIDAFLNWVDSNDVEFLGTEEKIVSLTHKWAGTRDTRAIVNGRRSVCDWKTSKGIYGEYFIQTAAYAKGGEELGEEPYEDLWVLRVPKDGKEFEAKSHHDLGVGYSIDELYEVFLGLYKAWEFNGGSKRRKKSL